ncbi:hypothetical protein MYRNA_114 [Mycobacterium phage Myrna]|uniref:Minor tail protein n=1 Tax=Mycobacterium phage Myrna TaxID=546805 RepID=B5LJB8_9CAUD|nr:gp114 [Mycobacterium phage Myrna]ACH62115.1 hypothetical protein MYRNA_114 [Mycobacterium phage Myrna]
MSRMITRGMGGGGAYPRNLFIGATGAEDTSCPLPDHQMWDVIIVFAFRDTAATQPTLPAGFTEIPAAGKSGNTCASRVGWKWAAGSSETSGTWTGATLVMAQVWRTSGIPGAANGLNGTSATVNYPALTFQQTNGRAALVAFGAHRSFNATMNVAPGTLSPGGAVEGAANDGASFYGLQRSTWASTNAVTTETSSGYCTAVIELGDPLIWENVSVSNFPTPPGKDAIVTAIGGGGGGAGAPPRNGSTRPSGYGGGGGGGGGYYKIRIPAAYIATGITMAQGAGGAAVGTGTNGNAGGASGVVSNGITWAALGGSGGTQGMDPLGGAGGGTSIPGEGTVVPVLAKENGAGGGRGSTSQATAGAGTNSTLAGAGGGGGGSNLTNVYNGGNGGSSANAAGGAGGVGNADAGDPGGNVTDLGPFGGGGGGGGAGGSGSSTAGRGALGGAWGGGGGGGGGKEGSFSGAANGANGGQVGYVRVEFVDAAA